MHSRTKLQTRFGGVLLTSLLLVAPPPASARGGWDDGDHHERHERRHHHGKHGRHHVHGDWCAPRHGYAYYAPPRPRHHHHHGYGPRYVAAPRYYCDPCNHWYDEEGAFHRHIHRHHHVALGVIPLVIAAATFGWVFGAATH